MGFHTFWTLTFEQQTGKKVVSDLNMKRFLESQQPHLEFPENDTPMESEEKDE